MHLHFVFTCYFTLLLHYISVRNMGLFATYIYMTATNPQGCIIVWFGNVARPCNSDGEDSWGDNERLYPIHHGPLTHCSHHATVIVENSFNPSREPLNADCFKRKTLSIRLVNKHAEEEQRKTPKSYTLRPKQTAPVFSIFCCFAPWARKKQSTVTLQRVHLPAVTTQVIRNYNPCNLIRC